MRQLDERPFVDLPKSGIGFIENFNLQLREPITAWVVDQTDIIAIWRRDVRCPQPIIFLAPIDQIQNTAQDRPILHRDHPVASDRHSPSHQRLAVGQVKQLDQLHVVESIIMSLQQMSRRLYGLAFIEWESHEPECTSFARAALRVDFS
jgi:hypothetical protein